MPTEKLGPKPPDAGGSLTDIDWPTKATDQIEALVSKARDKTKLVDKAARGLVYGLVGAVLGLMFLVVFLIALIRLLDAYLPFDPYSRRVWVVYVALGAIFIGVGAFFWVKGKRTPTV